jgi:hypothetical protein
MKLSYITALVLLLALCVPKVSNAQDEENGMGQTRKAKRARSAVKSIYGINLFHVTDENVGFSVSYERFLDKSMVSLYLPISYSIPRTPDDPITYTSNYSYAFQDTQRLNRYSKGLFYFYPGLKVYPWGANKKVSVAFGTSLVLATGMVNSVTTVYSRETIIENGEKYYVNRPLRQISEDEAAFKAGVMITSFFNMRPTKNWYFGMELGLGYCYTNTVGGKVLDNSNSTLAQFGFKIGYAK